MLLDLFIDIKLCIFNTPVTDIGNTMKALESHILASLPASVRLLVCLSFFIRVIFGANLGGLNNNKNVSCQISLESNMKPSLCHVQHGNFLSVLPQ